MDKPRFFFPIAQGDLFFATVSKELVALLNFLESGADLFNLVVVHVIAVNQIFLILRRHQVEVYHLQSLLDDQGLVLISS